MRRPSKWSSPQRFSDYNCVALCISQLHHACYMYGTSHPEYQRSRLINVENYIRLH
jgi:hypothetical protein